MFRSNLSHYRTAMLVLRLIIGVVFLVHGIQKFQMGHGAVSGFFTSAGIPMPAVAAGLIILLETAGAIALILGVLTRLVGAAFTLDMLGAIIFVHGSKGFSVANGGYELVLILLAASLALAIGGAGALSIDDAIARRREGGE